MAKILNIDALAKETRELVLGGKTYPIEPMTVENFIATTQAAEALGAGASLAAQVQATVDLIGRSVPTLDKDSLRRLPLEQLTKIAAFVRGDDVDADAAEADAGK